MKDTFQTTEYKGKIIHSCYDREVGDWEVKSAVGNKRLKGKSVTSMKRRISKEIERQKDFVTVSDFTKIKHDVNGNPRYYLPLFLTTEEKAREAGGVIYRGKQFGSGWVFQSYSLDYEMRKLNGE